LAVYAWMGAVVVNYRATTTISGKEYACDIHDARNLQEAEHAFQQWMYSEYELDFMQLPVGVSYQPLVVND